MIFNVYVIQNLMHKKKNKLNNASDHSSNKLTSQHDALDSHCHKLSSPKLRRKCNTRLDIATTQMKR